MEDTSEMDFLESELSIMTIGEEERRLQKQAEHNEDDDDHLHPVLEKYLLDHPLLMSHIEQKDKMLIVLSPLSTKHAFPRDWVTKKELASIVERPQRLLACSIGIAAAYSLSPSTFHISRSTKRVPLTSGYVATIHGQQWASKLEALCDQAHDKLAHNEIEVPDGWPKGDIYLNPDTMEALEGVVGAIESALDSVYYHGMRKAMIVVRPPGHHSHPCAPSGFCLINNVQIAIQYAFETQSITHAVILDIDLHHGDGSQEICWKRGGWKIEDDDESRENFDEYFKRPPIAGPKVGYFSLHDINSYPTEQGTAYSDGIKNASTCIMSQDVYIWNVHLQRYTSMEEFDKIYETKYKEIIRRAVEFLETESRHTENFKPLIMISAGFDGSEYETVKMQRHQVNLPTSFYHRFSKDVFKTFAQGDVFTNSKILSILEGGYSNEALCSGIFSHLLGFTDLPWDPAHGTKETVRELVRGCRGNWKPPVKPHSTWIQNVISLGRAMLPECVLHEEKQEGILLGNDESIIGRLRSSAVHNNNNSTTTSNVTPNTSIPT